jgi:hypothetical protein
LAPEISFHHSRTLLNRQRLSLLAFWASALGWLNISIEGILVSGGFKVPLSIQKRHPRRLSSGLLHLRGAMIICATIPPALPPRPNLLDVSDADCVTVGPVAEICQPARTAFCR